MLPVLMLPMASPDARPRIFYLRVVYDVLRSCKFGERVLQPDTQGCGCQGTKKSTTFHCVPLVPIT